MGFGFEDMVMAQQSAEHIMIMIDHGNRNTVTGKLISRIVAEGMLVEMGFGGDLMKMPHHKIRPWSEHTRLRNTLEGMNKQQLQLKTTLLELHKWKENNIFIMEEIQKLQSFNPSEMKISQNEPKSEHTG